MMSISKLTYQSAEEMIFGSTEHPISCGLGLNIGQGSVYPEINFTLPAVAICSDTLPEILDQYREMVTSILERAVDLQPPGLVLEFEHLPALSSEFELGKAITEVIKELLVKFHDEHKIPVALRVTISDFRDMVRPPRMRTGKLFEDLMTAFRENIAVGADLVAIESTGGKEVSDRALMEADIQGLLFALGVLAPRDMHHLWGSIVKATKGTSSIPSGDSACGFANTAMVLADRRLIPNVIAAVVRAMGAARTLIAIEEGAMGPSKDCAYEGPILKAITGTPIAMEGKTAACAHFSHVGNVAAAVCDLWSNESVQNVPLLSGPAPAAFAEMLIYDCRLMNEAIHQNQAKLLRDWLIACDSHRSVHALVITPEASFRIARAIVAETDDFNRTRAAALEACNIIHQGLDSGRLTLPDRELPWLDRIEDELTASDSESVLVDQVAHQYSDVLDLKEYDL
ncbi:hypothetical protein DRQ00_09400 [candidate division KSB1 bacterium]|nr:MAG: hypothetical protein DRQ00_09400 [candidate division KSB1 bacterium]